jgi:hypothetical protein
MAQFQFDTTTVAARENKYEILPAGEYVAQVTESEIYSLKSGNGTGLKLTVTVLTQGYNGRKIFCRLNVAHSSAKAEKIGQEMLRELCDAVGVVRMADTVELHNKPFLARVKIRKDDTGQYEPQNEIAGFKAIAATAPVAPRPGLAPVAPGSVPPAVVAGAQSGAATPPWVKRT